MVVDLRVMIMEYSTLPKSSELGPHDQIQFSVISKTPPFFGGGGGLLPCSGYSQRILSSADRTSDDLKTSKQ